MLRTTEYWVLFRFIRVQRFWLNEEKVEGKRSLTTVMLCLMLNPPLPPPLNDQEYVWTSSQVNVLINGAFNWIIDHIGYADIEGI